MKTVRTLCCTLRLLSAAASVAAPLMLGATVLACEDENNPKTWVKRLDDPAQRANAIKRLTQFYEDDMTRASNDASAPEVKELLDAIVDPLTKQYTAGGLDDKTRIDLMKFLAETHDPRKQPALAKALKDFEMGKTDDEVRVACESINSMAKSGIKLEQTVIDELWNVFSKFQLSKTNSERLYKAIHEAVVNVRDPSYGDKAIEKLKGAVNESVDSQKDQLMWWQLTSVQVLRELRYTKAVKPLIITLLTPSKTSTLGATIQFVLLKMAKDAEPELIKALNGQDPDYAKAAEGFETRPTSASSPAYSPLGRPPDVTPFWSLAGADRPARTEILGADANSDPASSRVPGRVQQARGTPTTSCSPSSLARPRATIGEVLRPQAPRLAAQGDEEGAGLPNEALTNGASDQADDPGCKGDVVEAIAGLRRGSRHVCALSQRIFDNASARSTSARRTRLLHLVLDHRSRPIRRRPLEAIKATDGRHLW
jgi:hypothetical protein